MPIVTITALPSDLDIHRLLDRVADAVSAGLGCPPDDVWVSFVAAAGQSIGGRKATPADQCPIVIVRGRPRGADSVAAALAATAAAVGAELGVPLEDVWLQWVEVTTGFAGGGFIA